MTMMCRIPVILTVEARIDCENQDTNDPELAPLFKLVLPPVELHKVPVDYYVKNGVLM